MEQARPARDTARRRAVTAMAASALVADVAKTLAPHGIAVMPFKGALLQHWLYDDPSERAMTDVDVLVRPEQFRRSVEVLSRTGYRRTPHQSVGGAVMATRFGLALDLHFQLFDRARYRMPTRDLFARGADDRRLYGAPVRLPSALDAYAHLVGKLGSDHVDARAVGRLDEVARMGRYLSVAPASVATHLVHCGLRRASRYALPLVHRVTGDPTALAIHRALPSDPVGVAVAALASEVLPRSAPHSRVAALVAHSMNDTLGRGLHSAARAWFATIHRSR